MWHKILIKLNVVNNQLQSKTQDIVRSTKLLSSLVSSFQEYRNNGFQAILTECEKKCSLLNIVPQIKRKRRKKMMPGEIAPDESPDFCYKYKRELKLLFNEVVYSIPEW